jgi:Rpp14/Pop5 family
MVRFKTRWILVKIETRQDVVIHPKTVTKLRGDLASRNSTTRQDDDGNDDTASSLSISKKEFIERIRKTISWCYGLSGEPIIAHTLVRLVLIRCPRQYCDQVRGALTLLLTPPPQQSSQPVSIRRKDDGLTTTSTSPSSSSSQFIVCTVVSIHGSVRTAKIATVRMVRHIYRHKINLAMQTEQQTPANIALQGMEVKSIKLCHDLQERLGTILSMD